MSGKLNFCLALVLVVVVIVVVGSFSLLSDITHYPPDHWPVYLAVMWQRWVDSFGFVFSVITTGLGLVLVFIPVFLLRNFALPVYWSVRKQEENLLAQERRIAGLEDGNITLQKFMNEKRRIA